METLVDSKDLLVRHENGRLTIERKLKSVLTFGGYGLIGSFVLIILGLLGEGLISSGTRDMGETLSILGLGGGGVILSLSVLLIAIGLFQKVFFKPVIIDRVTGTLTLGRKQFAFSSVANLRIESMEGLVEMDEIIADINGKRRRILYSMDTGRKKMNELAEKIEEMFDSPPLERMDAESVEAIAPQLEGARIGIVFIGIGLFVSLVGYIFLGDVIFRVFEDAGKRRGILLWPGGLWLALLGLLHVFRVPTLRWLALGNFWKKAAILVPWILSYVVIWWV